MPTMRSPPGPRITHLRLHRRADGREVLGGVGLAERAADRAAVAHHRVGDHLLGVAEDREVAGQQVGLEQVHVAGQRADPQLAVLPRGCSASSVEVVDVDQVLGARQAQLHHRQQAVAAGDDPGPGAAALERRDRAVDAGGPLVLEWRRGLQSLVSSSPLRATRRQPLARRSDVVALFVLVRCAGADHRRVRQVLGALVAHARDRAGAPPGCRPRRCAAPRPSGWRRRSAPRGRAAPA